MCVDRKVFLNLCDLFPVTQENLKERGLEKRLHYLKAMKRLDDGKKKHQKALQRAKKLDDVSPPYNYADHPSHDSLLDQKTLEALDNAAAGVADQLNTVIHEEQLEHQKLAAQNLDEEIEEEVDIENFFSDEDDKGMQAVEDLQSVIKRVTKKTANMIEAINQCQMRMDNNAQVIKRYIDEGRKPNKELRHQVMPLS